MWVSDWRLPTLREEMEEVLGPLAMFDVTSATAAEASPLSEPAAIAALSGANKLVMRARLQVGHHPTAPEALHGYGDGLDPAQLCRGDLVQPVQLGRWMIRRPNLAPGGGVAGNPGSLLPASGIWQPRIRAILVAYPKFRQA